MNRINRILLIDNFDSFTFNLVDYFRRLECEVSVYRNTLPVADVAKINPELIVFSPGPSIPSSAGNMMAIIDRWHESIPMFGVCLGHEAFIEYFGGSLQFVRPVHGKATTIHHDGRTIFKDVAPDFWAGRYHSLAAAEVPDCFNISATSEGLVMGIRHKNLPIESVQFHPESILTMKGRNGFKIIENLINRKMANMPEAGSH
ncbi:MAG: aminodeoxychorismate/anthranilate synthase component II [Deltaproteobacteria bacterium]|nr:aminodeoxychorismate/anthranilate synthase component II [Deltaproteobacteria bacterium]